MKKTLNLNEIELDKNNPRYATRENKNQSVANFMISHTKLEHINDMVKDIVEKGLSPLDTIGVFKENQKYIALDGNRRILALKILYSNNNINLPESTKSIVNQFKLNVNSKKLGLNEKINVFVFSNRNEAKVWLNRKHTKDFGGASTQDWPTFEKKIFQEKPLALFIAKEANIAGISYDDYAIKIKYTIWERMFTSNFSREWLGVSYLKNDKKFITNNREKLKKRMDALVKASNDGILHFNKVNKKSDKWKTINEIDKKYLLNSNYPNSFSVLNKNEKKLNKNREKSNKIKYEILDSMPNILKEIINECNTINYDKKRFLGAISIRSIIEYCTNFYLHKFDNKSENNLEKRKLKEKLNTIIEKLKKYDLRKFEKYWIKNDEYRRIIDHLNWSLHISNDEWKIDKDQLKKNVFAVNLIMKAIWTKKN